ncbi:MAG: dienelactone hydrolase family protein [Thermoflexales bacterium]|nr:dienelactone hydrolase family protein [Thermoflexales bacterium]
MKSTDRPAGNGLLARVEVETAASPTASVIWLHGLGADGYDFVPLVPSLRLPPGTPTRFVFPHAPELPVTVNVGHVMPAWFDLLSFDFEADVDHAGIAKSVAAVEALIAAEVARGVPANRIVLAGFSQGGVIAVATALQHARALAGVMLLSTYLPAAGTLFAGAQAVNRDCPVFLAHGKQDDLIPFVIAQRSRDTLRAAGHTVEWHEYDMPHAVVDDEIDDIGAWLRRVL